MKRFFCLFLTVLLVSLLFSGCENNNSLVGAWDTTIDLATAVRSVIQSNSLTEDTYTVKTRLTFNNDGSFTLTPDADELSAALNAMLNNLTADILDDLEKDSAGLNELLSLFGTDMGKITDKLQGNLNLETQLKDAFQDMSAEGYYKTAGDRLFLFPEENSKLPSSYIEFTLAEDTLTLEKHIGTNPLVSQNILFKDMPMTFTKAQ